MKKFFTFLLFCAFPLILFNQSLLLGDQGDLGDAPDSSDWWGGTAFFHTLRANQGPLHTDALNSTFWIGDRFTRGANTTTVEDDAKVVDNDEDDGRPFIFIMLIGIPAPANITVPITTSPSHNPNDSIFVNIAIDVDNDLDFDDNPDINWVVRNKIVHCPADTTIGFNFGPFGFGNDLLLLPVWIRVTVTNEKINAPWDGKGKPGGWTVGETEDWWFYADGARGHNARKGTGKPPTPPDTNNPKKPKKQPNPKKPKSKCANLIYPRIIKIRCEQYKCISIGVKDCSKDTAISNVSISFQFKKGVPLLSPPTVVSSKKVGKTTWFRVCALGWSCDDTEVRYAQYSIKVKYDPDSLFVEKEFTLDFRDDVSPYSMDDNDNFFQALVAEPADSVDYIPWFGSVGEQMTHQVKVWQGQYPGGVDWLTYGQPVLNVISAPSWGSFSLDGRDGNSSATYTFQGTPGIDDGGLEYLVLSVESSSADDNFDPWIWEIPIYIEGDNQAPAFDTGLEDTYYINVANHDSVSVLFTVHDNDILYGKRDTVFFDWFLWDNVNNQFYDDINYTFIDYGNQTGYFSWKPGPDDIGNYTLALQTWDYYLSMDSSLANVNVISMDADFKADYIVGFAPYTTTFTDLSTAEGTAILTYQWNFGDGSTSNQKNPIHTYNNSGTYTVELTVSDGNIENTETKEAYIVVNDIDFQADPTEGEFPLSVNFENMTTQNLPLSITSSTGTDFSFSWNWNFGDDETSELESPEHTYNQEGTYSVSLTSTIHITEVSGTTTNTYEITSPTILKENYITVYAPLSSDFEADITEGYAPMSVSFTDLSAGSPTSWEWDFGDNSQTDTNQNPIHIYSTPGHYDVTLTIYRGDDNHSITKENYIYVKDSLKANFTADTTEGFPPLTVQFTDMSKGEPEPNNWQWSFGDGASSTDQNPTHTYTNSGTFDVTLVVSNGDMTDSLKKVSYIIAFEEDSLRAYFVANPLSGELPLPVEFTDLSTGNPTSWFWTFGDDSTSTEQNPIHTYITSGTFTVSLTISDGINQAAETKENYIIVTAPSAIGDYSNLPFELYQNYPNPLTNMTNIKFTLENNAIVTLKVYNVLGNEVKTLINSNYKGSGSYTVMWDGFDNAGNPLPPGIYYYELNVKTNNQNMSKTKGMTIIR